MKAFSLARRFGAAYLFLLFFSLPLAAQEGGPPAEEKFKLLLGFDSRTTIINRETIGITGLRAGLRKNRYAFGIGGYDSRFLGILGRTLRKPFTLDEFSQERTVDADVDFRYLSVFGEYYLIRQEKIIIALNTQLGAGNIRVAYDLDGEPVVRKLRKGLVEHYAKLTVRPLPWLELSSGVGYRYLIDGEPQIKKSFSGPVYTIGGWIYFGKLFGRKKRRGKKGENRTFSTALLKPDSRSWLAFRARPAG